MRAWWSITVLPGVLVLGVGLAAKAAPLTATVLAAAPSEEAGVASAVNNDVGEHWRPAGDRGATCGRRDRVPVATTRDTT